MNINSLPTKVKKQIKPILKDETPVSVVRMSGSVDGNTGEGYVIALIDRICLSIRSLGCYDYVMREMFYEKDIELIVLRKEKYNLLMELTVGGKLLVLKFSSYQEDLLYPIIEQWSKDKGLEPGASATQIVRLMETEKGVLSPYAAATALLIFMATADGDISAEEDEYIKRFCGDDKAVLGPAYDYYKGHEFDDLLVILAKMDHQQKMCVFANTMDVSMIDGVLHKVEQEMMLKCARTVGLSDEDIGRVREILLVKNQISVLCG
ncbi:MAG: TerB family tellurite resistance protein [Kiritimatiellae bacterium]|nr:TerB family tellurite resistance protein [Kiritimatiellia bacterium]